MSWAIGYDNKWQRDIGYGVPAICDHPKCNKEIDRGLSYVCGAQQVRGGENGCGLYFCGDHLKYHSFRYGESGEYCKRCATHKQSYNPKPDVREWIEWKLKDESWEVWRKENPEEVKEMIKLLTPTP